MQNDHAELFVRIERIAKAVEVEERRQGVRSLGYDPDHFRPPQRRPVWGGDWVQCLDDQELDIALRPLGRSRLPARLFFDLARGMTTSSEALQLLHSRLECSRRVFAPVHCRHHWLLAIFELTEEGTLRARLLDSAPSPCVWRDVQRLLYELEPEMLIVHNRAPRQGRGTFECGLFVVANCVATLLNAHWWYAIDEVSLAELRVPPGKMWGAAVTVINRLERTEGGAHECAMTHGEIVAVLAQLGPQSVVGIRLASTIAIVLKCCCPS